MRKLILSVTAVVAMLFGGVMFFAPSASADAEAGTAVYSVGSDSITLHTPTNLSYPDPSHPEWNYIIHNDAGYSFVCGNVNGNGQLCGDPRVVSLQPGTYTLSLVISFDQTVDEHTFTIAPKQITVMPIAPTQSGNKVTIPTSNCVTYSVNGSPVTGVVTLTKNTTVVATANQGCVLAQGAKSSWTFTFTPPTPDPVYNPTASITLNKDGSGVATLNNTGSSESVGYE